MKATIEQSNMYEVRTFSGFTGVWVNASNLKEAYQEAEKEQIHKNPKVGTMHYKLKRSYNGGVRG